MKLLFAVVVLQVLVATSSESAHASSEKRICSAEARNVRWKSKRPAPVCRNLVNFIRYEITGKGPASTLTFKFQGVTYTAQNASADPNNLVFQYAADADSGSESATIAIEGRFNRQNFSGKSNVEVKKNISLLKLGKTDEWSQHRYNCEVSFDFDGSCGSEH